MLELNALETARFGITAARLADPAMPLDRMNAQAAKLDVALITARVAADDLPRVHALEADGFRLMDTLVYYSRSLSDLPAPRTVADDWRLVLATPADAAAVAQVAQAAFKGYFGHYHADPRLDNAAADAAYVEWATHSIAQCNADAPALLALRGDAIVGFLTLRRNSASEVEIVLNAVHPDRQRGGVYSALIAQALVTGAEIGASSILISTQINNYAVQKVWARAGFCHSASIYTFHKWMPR